MNSQPVAARINEIELFNSAFTGKEYTIRGATYTVMGFTKSLNNDDPDSFNGMALLRRGNGDVCYTLSMRGDYRPWNRSIITDGSTADWNNMPDWIKK